MDKRTDDGRPRTPLERIKAEHELMHQVIHHGDADELDWDHDINPQQVGLQQVWADENGHLWTFVRGPENRTILKRIWHLS